MCSEGHLFTFSDRTLMPLLTSSAVKSLMERQGWYVLTANLTTLKFGIRQATILRNHTGFCRSLFCLFCGNAFVMSDEAYGIINIQFQKCIV